MPTRVDIRNTGAVALVTGALLGTSLVIYQGGPPATVNPDGLVRWFTAEGTMIRSSAVLWLLAMLGLGLFGVSFRESMWAAVLDHPWVTLIFVHGAAVVGTIAVVATGIVWALAVQASSGALDAGQAVTHWEMAQALLLFATWGLAAPLIVIALVLWRYSGIGQLAAAAGVLLAVALLLPLDRTLVLFGFSAWLAFVGTTLLLPMQPRITESPEVASDLMT